MKLNESPTPNLQLPFLIALQNHKFTFETDPNVIHGFESYVSWDVGAYFNVIDIKQELIL
jgi:hypothetical protein